MNTSLITPARIRDVSTGFQTIFNKAMAEAAQRWALIATKVQSTSHSEVYGWMKDTFGMKKLIGEVTVEGLEAADYTIVNEEFHDTKGVAEKDIEDDRLGVYQPRFALMGAAASRAYDEVIYSDILSGGFANKCWDGKAFFANNHPTGFKAGTFSNLGTKKFSAANLKTAIAAIKTVKAANGRSWGFGKELLLVVSPKWEFDARAVLFPEMGAGANELRNACKLEVNAFLENEDSWFVMEVGWPVKPLILQERKPISIASDTNANGAYVILNHNYIFQAYGRYAGGYGIPAMAWGSTGADAA